MDAGFERDDLRSGSRAPEAELAPPFNRAGTIAHRSYQLAFQVEGMGSAALTEHDDGLPAGVEKKVFLSGPRQVGKSHSGWALPFEMMQLGMMGTALLGALALFQPPRQAAQQPFQTPLEASGWVPPILQGLFHLLQN